MILCQISVEFKFSVFIYHLQKVNGYIRIKLSSAASYDLISDFLLTFGNGVGTLGCHGIVAVSQTDYPCFFRDLFSLKSVRIAISVISFMMPSCSLGKPGDLGYCL